MNTVFFRILNMSITAGWFILAVIIIRTVCRDIPRRFVCILWGLVAAAICTVRRSLLRFTAVARRW